MSDVQPRFRVVDSTVSQLWDFGWFDLTRFEIGDPPSGAREPQDLLRAFLLDRISYRSLCSPGSWGDNEDLGRHGPFLHEQIVAEWFLPASTAALADSVRRALADPEFSSPPSEEQTRPVERWLNAVATRGDSAFVLEAPDGARVDLTDWHLEVWTVYHEFACVSPDRRELTIAVIGYD